MKRHVPFLIALLLCACATVDEKPAFRDLLQKGASLEEQGVYAEAIKLYSQAITADPANAGAYFRRGRALRVSSPSQSREALTDLDRAVDLAPGNAEAYYQRGLLNAFIIRNEAAREDMKTAAALGHEGAKKWLAAAEPQSQSPAAAPPPTVKETPPPPPPKAEPTEIKTLLPGGREPVVYFAVNMAAITPEAAALLDEIAAVLKEKLPAATIVAAGHADSSGPEGYNEALSLRRARAVQSYLVERHGLDAARITARGYGERSPAAPNDTPEGRAKNRRVELILGR